MHISHGRSTSCLGPWTAAHQLILFRLHSQAKHISIQRVTLLIHRWLAPAARLVPELGARRDGRIQTRDLRRSVQPLHRQADTLRILIKLYKPLIASEDRAPQLLIPWLHKLI